MTAQSYLSRGVSATKDDVKKAVSNQSKGIFPGSFCKIIPDIAGDPGYCCAVHADGAGTKSSVAYIMYRETNESSWFRGIAQDSLVMNTDDLAAIGAVNGFYLSNTIGRNAHRVDGGCIAEIISGYNATIEMLSRLGIKVIMTGGETADVGDLVRTVIADSTAVVRMRRDDVISAANIRAGDVIIGLASYGRSVYEEKENSGIGSNGLTAARHALLSKVYLQKYPESVSETIHQDKIYCGRYTVNMPLRGSSLTAGEALLSPTRTYLPVLNKVFNSSVRGSVSGLIHCTGGGQVKCKDFGNNLTYIKDDLFDRPAIFEAVADSGEIPETEMYQIFNMGHRMEIFCSESARDEIIAISQSFGIDAKQIGYVESGKDAENKVVIHDRGNEFVY